MILIVIGEGAVAVVDDGYKTCVCGDGLIDDG
jgi:hypothetical protein